MATVNGVDTKILRQEVAKGYTASPSTVIDLTVMVEELEVQNTSLKEELFCKDMVKLTNDCKKYATENFRLKRIEKAARAIADNAEECTLDDDFGFAAGLEYLSALNTALEESV